MTVYIEITKLLARTVIRPTCDEIRRQCAITEFSWNKINTISRQNDFASEKTGFLSCLNDASKDQRTMFVTITRKKMTLQLVKQRRVDLEMLSSSL